MSCVVSARSTFTLAIALSCGFASAQSPTYANDFDSLAGMNLFGSPLPRLSTNTPDGSGTSFDNNGDGNYDSGAVIEGYSIDFANGARIEADMFVTEAPTGCWLDAGIFITDNPDNVSSTQSPHRSIGFFVGYSGDACWAEPQDERRMSRIRGYYWGTGGTRYLFDEVFPGELFADQWVHTVMTINPVSGLTLEIDGMLIWSVDVAPDLAYSDLPIWIGGRSSSFGDALIDNLRVYENIATPPVITEQPAPVIVADHDGSMQHFSITASLESALQYQWHKDGVPINDGELFSGTNTNELAVTAWTTNTGEYTCVVSNNGGASVTSDPGVLAVRQTCVADTAQPYGIIDLTDIVGFIGTFNNGCD